MFGNLAQRFNARMMGKKGRDDNTRLIGALLDARSSCVSLNDHAGASKLSDRISGLLEKPHLYNPNLGLLAPKEGQLPDTLLCKLLRQRMSDQVSLLLKSGFDPRQFPEHRFIHQLIRGFCHQETSQPLHLLDELLQAGCDLHALNERNSNAFFTAVNARRLEWVAPLHQAGLDSLQIGQSNTDPSTANSLLHYFKYTAKSGAFSHQLVKDTYLFLLSQGTAKIIRQETMRNGNLHLWLQDHAGAEIRFNNRVSFNISRVEDLGLFGAIDEIQDEWLAPVWRHLNNPTANPHFPETLTREGLLQLYAIGKGDLVFTPAFWRGHEARFMEHYDTMPPHLREQFQGLASSCSLRLMQQQRLAPDPVLFSGGVAYEGMAEKSQQGRLR